MSAVGLAVKKILYDDSGVGAIAGDRIYPNQAEQGATLPFVTYDVISNVPTNSKGNTSHIDAVRVQLSCIASTYASAVGLAAAVRTALDGYTGTPSGTGVTIRSTQFDGENDLLQEEDVWGVAIDFIFNIKR